ncbi:MAG: hypothetical protein SNF93_01600 [Rikenellaceae bacterium]
MAKLKLFLITLLSVLTTVSHAQDYSDYRFSSSPSYQEEPFTMIEVDTTLFRMPVTHSTDAYSDATRYYRAQGALRRRGLYYTTAEQIVGPAQEYITLLEQPLQQSQVTLYGAQSGYRMGLRATDSRMLKSSWSLSSSLWAQTGRDMFVEGVFRNTAAPQITLSKRFNDNDFLVVSSQIYYSMRGLQYGSTSEVFGLVGTNYYNPTWGFYDGQVRNSRVRRQFTPNISLHFQRAASKQTTFTIEANAEYNRTANSSLGWYNATTPQADYYRKLPSYMPEGDVQDYVTNVWRTANSDYTQINWDELVRLNSLDADGQAHYTLEDQVKRSVTYRVAAIAKSVVSQRLRLTYGIEYEAYHDRYFKQMRDLLGADYLIDYDIFMGDSYNKTLPLQNDLQNPDNYITQGDRFGYDYTQHHSVANIILRAQYQAQRLDFDLEATIGQESFYRVGHYEKERFASSASFGQSPIINCSPYTLRATVGYAYGANKYFALKLVSSRLSPQSRNLFLNEQDANYLSNSLKGESIQSATLAFRYNHPWISLYAELYALQSRNGSSVYSLYDDLTSTMCRASITQIGYSSYGAEVTADFRLHYDLKFSATLAAGKYTYDTNPFIELLDDYDLTTISAPTESRMSGVNIGNAPQIAATTSLTYFGFSRMILGLSSSYSGLRYEQPSIARRSERLLSQAFTNVESQQEALQQQRLSDIFDVEISASHYFWFEDGGRLSLRVAVRNLLGDDYRVVYAKESDRIILQSIDDYFSGATMRQSTYQYGLPRTIQLSASYLF